MAKNDDGPQNGGAITPPDFEKALKVITNDLNPLLELSGVGISRDLVDQAEGGEAKPVIPVVDKSRPELATVN